MISFQPKQLNSSKPRRSAGFSLMELLVAMAVFMVIGGAAFNLVRRHVPLYNNQQSQAGLNMTMRNAATQIQIDTVNAGSGYYTGTNVPAWPVGITIVNNPPSTTCFDSTTFTYGATCFDWLNIITTDNATAPGRPSGDSGGVSNANTNTMGIIYVKPITAMSAAQLTAYAGTFKTGDVMLFITQDGKRMTTTKLTANASVVSSSVKLNITSTNADGTNTAAADPLGLTDVTDPTNDLGVQYSPTTDYVLKLSRVTYCVDTSTASNPQLVRMVNITSTTCSGTTIAEQIIGFKVGAYTIDTDPLDDTDYNFNRPAMTTKYHWGAIRSVRISMIGRTQSNPTAPFRNSFDQGPYKVEAISVVVNPRNLSMND